MVLLIQDVVPRIEEVTITVSIGQKIVPLPESSSCLGFMFSRADTPTEAESSLRTACCRLEIAIRPPGKGSGDARA